MIKLIFVFFTLFINQNKFENDCYTFYINFNNVPIKKGYIHFLSNDNFINDISSSTYEEIENKDKSCHIGNQGIYQINKKLLDKRFNKIKSDSMYVLIRCERGFGQIIHFSLLKDTITINLKDSVKNSCFLDSKKEKRGKK